MAMRWKGLVRMVKYWNNNPKHGDLKPVKPSFLIEVMALECLYGGWGGSFDRGSSRSLPRLPIEFMTSGRIPPDLARRSATQIWMPRASSAQQPAVPGEPRRKHRHRPRASWSQYRSASRLARTVWPQVPTVLIPSASIHVPSRYSMSQWSLSQLLSSLHEDIQQRLSVVRKTFGHQVRGGCERERLDRHAGYLSAQTVPGGQGACGGQPGNFSQQIDVVVFDRQYSPFIFTYENETIIPAESVYAVSRPNRRLTRGLWPMPRRRSPVCAGCTARACRSRTLAGPTQRSR